MSNLCEGLGNSLLKLTVAGTVPDLHRIPFSSRGKDIVNQRRRKSKLFCWYFCKLRRCQALFFLSIFPLRKHPR